MTLARQPASVQQDPPMQTIFRTDGRAFYYPSADGNGLSVMHYDSPQAATRHLLTLLQCFIDISLGDPAALPPTGFHVYANTLTGDYLVLAVSSLGTSVYQATQADLDRLNLPIPPRSF